MRPIPLRSPLAIQPMPPTSLPPHGGTCYRRAHETSGAAPDRSGDARTFAWPLSRFRAAHHALVPEGYEHVAPHAAGAPVVVAFWHERLALMPMLWLQARRTNRARARAHVLVSRHRDGQFIGAVVSRFDLDVVLGSSSRGGAKGLRILLNLLAGGDHIAITPDGPRGPRRVAAPGVAQLAALSGVPVLPCAAQTRRRWLLPTWDRMVVPKPFGRGVVVCLPTIVFRAPIGRT